MDVMRELAALRRRLRLLTLAWLGSAVILVMAMGGADATAKAVVMADAWRVQSKNAGGTLTPRLTVTGDVDNAEIKVLNGNVGLFPQTTTQLPAAGPAGAIAFDSTVGKFKVYNGTAWVEPGGGGIAFREFTVVATPQTAQAWTNMPSANTEMYGLTWNRRREDLTGFSQFRLVCNQSVAGASTAKLWLEYSTDQSAWTRVEDAGGTTADLVVGTGTGVKTGAFANIATAAKADLFFRLMGSGGNGTADPAFRWVGIQVK